SRVYCAPFTASLSAPGFSISVVNVPSIHELLNVDSRNADGLNIATGNNEDDVIDLFALLDAPSDAYSWLCVRLW
ncbi:hypothetical protein BD769DRAFT_1338394, partial [Suillus cothurnatus]